MDTRNTLEVIAAASLLSIAIKKAREDDGKVSMWEAGLILFNQRKPVREAWEQIDQIDDELLDLDLEEWNGLVDQVKALLATWDLSHRAQDITEEVIKAGIALARAVHKILHLPPVALPA